MATTYGLIASNVLSSTATSVGFSSIPTYTDLIFKISARSTRAGRTTIDLTMNFNSSSNTSWSYTYLYGNGTTAVTSFGTGGASTSVGSLPAGSSTANVFSNTEIYIPSYLSSAYKVASTIYGNENNTTTAAVGTYASLWSETGAVSSILFSTNTGFAIGSSFYLYGIKNS